MPLVTTRLRTCPDCGAAVDPVDGGRRHEQWHLRLAASVMPPIPEQPPGSRVEQRSVIVNARSETIAVIDERPEGETLVAMPHHYRSHHPLPEEPPSKMVTGATPANQSQDMPRGSAANAVGRGREATPASQREAAEAGPGPQEVDLPYDPLDRKQPQRGLDAWAERQSPERS